MRPRTPDPRRRRGFTLVEVLVALGATAVVLAALATAVPTTLRANAGARARLEQETVARTLLLHLERELATALPEPFLLASAPVPRLEFTGGAEPGERVTYTVERGALVRRALPRFAPPDPDAHGVALVHAVAALSLEAFDGRAWVAPWRAGTPPEAVRIRLAFDDGEAVETIAVVPTARRRTP